MRSAAPIDWECRSLSKLLARIVSKEFESEDKRKEFEQWYEKTYGRKYVWKKGSEINATKPQTT